MARRRPLLLLAVGLVALLVFVLVDEDVDPDAGGADRTGSRDGRAVDGASALSGVDGDPESRPPVAQRDEVDVSAVDRTESDGALAEGDGADAPRVEGRLVVLDPDLGPRLEESGVLVAYPWKARGPSRPVRLEVDRGRFDPSELVRDAYRIGRARMDSPRGPRGVLFDDSVFDVRPGEALMLQGRYLPVRMLRVLDASTGERRSPRGDMLAFPVHATP